MNSKKSVLTIKEIDDDKFYGVEDLKSVLRNLGLNYSIFSIRDAETWKCLNYRCGKRFNEKVKVCEKCGSEIRAPRIKSPRSSVGGLGVGWRKYQGKEVKAIVETFKERNV